MCFKKKAKGKAKYKKIIRDSSSESSVVQEEVAKADSVSISSVGSQSSLALVASPCRLSEEEVVVYTVKSVYIVGHVNLFCRFLRWWTPGKSSLPFE